MNVTNPGQSPTKERFFPVHGTTGAGASLAALAGIWMGAVLTALNDRAFMAFHVPHDFNTIVQAVVLVNPVNTNAAENWGTQAVFAADGEAYNTHNAGDSVTTYAGTASQLIEVDVSNILGAALAGDYGSMSLILEDAAHDCYVLGFRLRYT